MTATILLIVSIVVLLGAALGVSVPGIQAQPLGIALAAGAWLAVRLALP